MARVVVALAVLSASATAFAPSRSFGVRRAASGVHAASLEDTPAAPAAAATADAAPGLAGVRPDLAAAFGRTPTGMLDEEAALARSAFPLPPETLIGLTKAWPASQVEDDGMDWFADDFRFVAPVVGPFGKDEFVASLKGFELQKAFPDLEANPHHFRVDPFEPDRVWWSVKYVGTNTGPILGRAPTMRAVESPVQAQSATFNARGEITKFTIGYVLDKETGNTGGLGGVFGLFYACGLGLPFPEAQPYKASPIYGTLMSANKAIQGAFKANPEVKKRTFDVLTAIGAMDNGAK